MKLNRKADMFLTGSRHNYVIINIFSAKSVFPVNTC